MEFVINDKTAFDTFANIFQHLKEFNDSFNFMFSRTGLFIQGFDKCHISIFELNLNAEWFAAYTYTSPQEGMQIGFNPKIFHKILTTRQDNQEMVMSLGSDTYMIQYIGGGKKEYNKTFKIPMLDVDCELFTIPKVEENVEFKILQSSFASIIDQLILFGENVNIKINNDFVMFHAEGIEGEMDATISTNDMEEFSADECEEDDTLINQDYSLKLLKTLCLFSKIGNCINVSVSNGRPICIAYDIVRPGAAAAGTAAAGTAADPADELDSLMDNMSLTDDLVPTYLRLYLAPKIE